LIVLILLVFEGKSLIGLFSDISIRERIQSEEEEVFASANLLTPETESESEAMTESEAETEAQEKETEAPKDDRMIGLPDGTEEYLTCVLPAQATEIDESYFDDAVFIGDSRMEGFRNFSGITKGSFVTSVGMEMENFYTDAQIPTAKGPVLAMDALKNLNFSKIYIMLGTNELGAYDMPAVKDSYTKLIQDVKSCSSSTDPVVYVFPVMYVEEALVMTGDYVNNTNVDTLNTLILEMCKENGYHYINLNEILTDGNHALISGASEDGIHLNQEYCEKILGYTKKHYIPAV
ncbi:MAG: GDSL-type esterase/lipase family protein, partial [Eubacteriales bacterium]|nr:GDSL-type esterase/lipase family protein [Eubacteriales bacterium]